MQIQKFIYVGRILLIRILDSYVNKFSSLKYQIPKFLANKVKAHKGSDNIKGKQRRTHWLMILDVRMLLKSLIIGLKNIIYAICSCTPNYRSLMVPSTQMVGTMVVTRVT